jgi:hypothetical protein
MINFSNLFIKKIVSISALYLLSVPLSFSQSKPKNRIIIWDVTASMLGSTNGIPPYFGYNLNSDIDGDVRAGMIKIINDSPDEAGEFRIIPFGTDIIESNKIFQNNKKGRTDAINYIKSYFIEKKPKGYTNICGAWDKSMNFIDPNKENIIYLFTDGSQNVNYGKEGKNCLSSIVEKYCNLTRDSETFTFFVSLNVSDVTFSAILNNACSKNLKYLPLADVKKNGVVLPISLMAKFNPVNINIQDSLPAFTERFNLVGGTIPKDFKIRAELQIDPQFPLDIKCKVKSNSAGKLDVEFSLDDISGKTIQKMKTINNLNIECKLKLTSGQNGSVSFEPSELTLKIINKKPQQLNFYIK